MDGFLLSETYGIKRRLRKLEERVEELERRLDGERLEGEGPMPYGAS